MEKVDSEHIIAKICEGFRVSEVEKKSLDAITEFFQKATPCDRWGGKVHFGTKINFGEGMWYDTSYSICLYPNGTYETESQFVMSDSQDSNDKSFGVYQIDGDKVIFQTLYYDERGVQFGSFSHTLNGNGHIVVNKGETSIFRADADEAGSKSKNPSGWPCTLNRK